MSDEGEEVWRDDDPIKDGGGEEVIVTEAAVCWLIEVVDDEPIIIVHMFEYSKGALGAGAYGLKASGFCIDVTNNYCFWCWLL